MQTPLLFSKRAVFICWSKMTRNLWDFFLVFDFDHNLKVFFIDKNVTKMLSRQWLIANRLGIQAKSIRGLGAVPPTGGVGGQAPHKNGGFMGAETLYHEKKIRICLSPECITMVKCKIDHNSKTKNRKIDFSLCASFMHFEHF